jgi:hypothetical protein
VESVVSVHVEVAPQSSPTVSPHLVLTGVEMVTVCGSPVIPHVSVPNATVCVCVFVCCSVCMCVCVYVMYAYVRTSNKT